MAKQRNPKEKAVKNRQRILWVDQVLDELNIPEKDRPKMRKHLLYMKTSAFKKRVKKMLAEAENFCQQIDESQIIPQELIQTPFGPVDGSGVWFP